MVEITAEEQNKGKRIKRIEDSLRDIWDNIKCTNIRVIGVPEEEEKRKSTENFFEEIIVENFPNMEKEIGSSSTIQFIFCLGSYKDRVKMLACMNWVLI